MLPHIASLGFDIVYLTACFAADNNYEVKSWSPRQLESGCGNPKNPYKMIDYFNVDDEYGANDDLHKFVETAHEIGLAVMFDLVYLHCGKNAVFIKDNPDFVKRDKNGAVLIGEEWPFARLDFDNPKLREYLYSNMEYFLKEYDVDGFRCDVADKIPLDFWEEGIRRIKAIKPDIYMLCEGESSKFIEHAFDGSYHWVKRTKLINMYKNSADMNAYKKVFEDEPYYNRTLNYIDNHDEASDAGINRCEKVFGNDGVESMIFLIYTIAGIPFLWNGMEICDDSENCMFSNRYFGRKNFINWSYGMLNKGKKRMELVKELSELYHTKGALYDGTMDFVNVESDSNALLSFIREKDDEALFVCVNTGNSKGSFKVKNKLKSILNSKTEQNGNDFSMGPYGYIIADILE